MDWLFEASRDIGRRIPWISIPGVASNGPTYAKFFEEYRQRF